MRPLRLALAPLLALAVLVAPSVASGAAYHPFLAAINGGYEDACGVTLRGGLSVSSYYQNTVITPGGRISPESSGSGPCKIELDAAGDLYVNNWHEDVVKYSSSELLPGHGSVIDSAEPTGLAVEQTSGDLYVAHRTYIAKYNPTGTLLETLGIGQLEEAYGVAVSEYPATLGDIYVPDAATETVKIFNPGGTLIGELDGANTPQGHFTYFRDGEVAVDNNLKSPSYGHIYVLDGIGHGLTAQPAAVLDEFNAAGDYRGQISGFADAEPSGVAIDATTGNLYLTSGNSEESKVFTYGPTSPAKTLTVVKEGAGAGTVTSSPSAIACGAYCAAEFNENQLVTLFAIPDAHSAFTGWSVSGAEPCPGTGSCTVLMAKGVEVKASFAEPTQETLTVSSSGEGTLTSDTGGISCPAACTEHFAQGRVVTLKAAPAAHRRLAGWSGCMVQSNPAECKVTMSEDQAVNATFEAIPQRALSLSLTGAGQGTVSSYPPGISCPPTCSASFDEGSTVYLLAAPSPGSSFGGFAGGACGGTATLCAVPMSSSQEVQAAFGGIARGPAAPAALAHSGSFALVAVRTRPSGALLAVRTQEAGALLLSGPGLRAGERRLAAGTSHLHVVLESRARLLLARRHRLRIRLVLGFLPTGAAEPSSAAAVLHFHTIPSAAKAQRRHR